LHDTYIKTRDYKKALATVVYDKLLIDNPNTKVPSINSLMNQEDTSFSNYIIAILEDSDDIKACYNETLPDAPIIQRFVMANLKYYEHIGENIAKALSTMAFEMSKIINFDIIQQSLQDAMSSFASVLLKYDLQPYLQSFATSLSNAFKTISVPWLSDDDKRSLEKSYKDWGKHGWTLIPNTNSMLYSTAPANLAEANRLMLNRFKKNDLDALFSLTHQQKIKKADYDEAVICFKYRQYKACALILCGLIDSLLIKQQQKQKEKGGRRVTGFRAVEILSCKFDSVQEKTLSYLLLGINCMQFLEVLFGYTNDFTKKPPVINRHLIAHGMNKTPVRKTDCVKLFLLLYNLSEFLDITTGLIKAFK
jgi:hypothetical protein